MKQKWKVGASLLMVVILIFCLGSMTGCQKAESEIDENGLKVTVFRVGKADAIVLESGEHTMVIDVGEEEDGEEVVAYLEHEHISKVDTLIITHYDHDHVGGADTLIEAFDIGKVFVPAYEGSNVEYVDFKHAMEKKGIHPEALLQPVDFLFGDANVLVEPPSSYEIESSAAEMDNNFSLITTVTHGKNTFLFTGDAEKWRTRDWLANGTVSTCDVLKVPHHGVYNKAMEELIEVVKPKYAIVCSSNKNPADPETLEMLKESNVTVLQTKDGNVTIVSDGEKLDVDQELEAK